MSNLPDTNCDRTYCVSSKKYNPIYLRCMGTESRGYIFFVFMENGDDIFGEPFDVKNEEIKIIDELCEHPNHAILYMANENEIIHIISFYLLKTSGKIQIIST